MPLIGPFHGISEQARAKDAPIRLTKSGSLSSSIERTVATTKTSRLKRWSKSGRIVLSIKRPLKIAASEALPSRRTKRLHKIFLRIQRLMEKNPRLLFRIFP